MRTGWNAEETCRYFVDIGEVNESIPNTEKIASLGKHREELRCFDGVQIKVLSPIECQIKNV
jgi:hypothetical protein